jgi:hypothetical protein
MAWCFVKQRDNFIIAHYTIPKLHLIGVGIVPEVEPSVLQSDTEIK